MDMIYGPGTCIDCVSYTSSGICIDCVSNISPGICIVCVSYISPGTNRTNTKHTVDTTHDIVFGS